METRVGTAGRLGVMVLVALVAALAWIKPLEAPASETLDATIKKAFITFAAARALNGGISLLQSGQVSVQAVGGVSFNPGEVLDPINDLVEQFSNVMLAATVALGIQKVLLAMGMHWVLPVLVTAVAAVWIAFSAFGRGSPRWITQLLVLLLMVRFAVPLAMLGTKALSDTFLESEYRQSQLALDEMKGKSDVTPPSAQGAAEEKGFWDKLKGAVTELGGMRERVAQLKEAAGQLAERVTMLIVVFLLETMVFPLGIIWLFFVAAKAILRSTGTAFTSRET